MNNFREKAQVFIIGLMVGLIISGGFFILKLDDYFKELNFYKRVAKTFSAEYKNNESFVKTEESASSKEKNNSANNSKNKKNKSVVTAKSDYVMHADTLKPRFLKDSSAIENKFSEEIIVRKDELLSTKTVEVINLNPIASRSTSKDSLLQKVSGVKDDRNNVSPFFNIEFWHSPLNYKGYKMSKYKIVLYGIDSEEGLKIFKLDDIIYLKMAAQVIRLDYASDFRQYEHVTDENIITKLK